MAKIKDRVLRTQDMTEEFMERWSKTFGRMEIVESMEDKAMTKEGFDKKYVGKKIVVSCKTKELAKEFLELADSFDYKWWTSDRYVESWCLENYDANRYYWLYEGAHCSPQTVGCCKLKVVEFESLKCASMGDKFGELNEQLKVMPKILEYYKPLKVEMCLEWGDFRKKLSETQTIPIEEAYKIEAKTESMDEVLISMVKERIDGLRQEIEAFQMTIEEFREKIGSNLEKVELLEEIIENYEDELKCKEYESENCGNVGGFNADNY